MTKKLPTFKFEQELWQKGYIVIGIDEVGRGALSGPITVGAVCFPFDKRTLLEKVGINDSKKISPNKRQKIQRIIKKSCLFYSLSCISSNYINNHNIVKAEEKAIREAVRKIRGKLKNKKIYLLLDAYTVKYVRGIGIKNQTGIIKGDQLSITIASASIIAKCHRDQIMRAMHQKYPKYGWNKNKGYGTKKHITALKKYGKSRFHRDLFIRNII